MEVKSLGGGKSFARTINYLGTTGDMTLAHNNLGILGYKRAKQSGNRKLMNYFSPYLRRDLMTFGNMPCGNKEQISHYEQLVMSNNNRKVKSRQFILMPSDKDEINPNNPDSVLRFKKYITKWVDNSFNGQFKKVGKNKRGNARYKFIRNGRQNFNWYAVIQPDSHDNSRVHAHIVVLNNNLMNGKAMGNNYYNIYHLRRAVNQVANDTGFSRATTKKSIHEPSRIEKWIIESARDIVNNPDITSRSKFIKALAKNGVTAHFRRNRKHPERNGWKFKVQKHSYVKASHISQAVGGSFLATDNIKKELSDNRKLHAKRKRKIMAKQEAKFAKTQRIKKHRYMMKIEQNEMTKLERSMKRVKREKRKKRARIHQERFRGSIRVQQAVKDQRKVLSECRRTRYRNHQETERATSEEEQAGREPKRSVDVIKAGIDKIRRFIRNKLQVAKHAVKSMVKPKHATKLKRRHRPAVSIPKVKPHLVEKMWEPNIPKKPWRPIYQPPKHVKKVDKSKTSYPSKATILKRMRKRNIEKNRNRGGFEK